MTLPPHNDWIAVTEDGELPLPNQKVLVANKRYNVDIYDRDIVTYRDDKEYRGFYRGYNKPAYKNIRFWAKIPELPEINSADSKEI